MSLPITVADTVGAVYTTEELSILNKYKLNNPFAYGDSMLSKTTTEYKHPAPINSIQPPDAHVPEIEFNNTPIFDYDAISKIPAISSAKHTPVVSIELHTSSITMVIGEARLPVVTGHSALVKYIFNERAEDLLGAVLAVSNAMAKVTGTIDALKHDIHKIAINSANSNMIREAHD